MLDLIDILSRELSLQPRQIKSVIDLTAEGATVPFLARYRKEATGNLDEVQIRGILERYQYLSELEERKASVLKSIEEQGKLTDELRARIEAALEKQVVEDLYAPYRPKRRTRAQVARERGLAPLAERMLAQGDIGADIRELARPFISEEKGVSDEDIALAGARDIIAEQVSDDADIRALAREYTLREGEARGEVIPGKEESGAKFRDYFDFRESVSTIPSHRILALRRAEAEEVLSFRIEIPEERLIENIKERMLKEPRSPWAPEVSLAIEDAFKRLLWPAIEAEIRLLLKKRADEEAIDVFGKNLKNLLLAPPLGGKRVLAIDPGFRTGCKVAVLTETGRFVETATIYPHPPNAKEKEARETLQHLVDKHQIEAIAVGNATAGRETERFVRDLFKERKQLIIVSVEESGASVYSASDIARDEFPSLDVTVRGAISIGRRLQDPLAELVKIDPKSIGVGQYQHDVDQPRLKSKLNDVVESCVNLVGVDANLASAPLLSYVSGIGPALAKSIVAYRNENGPFRSRADLRKVPRFGPKTFEQAAGFLKISTKGAHPLDASAVHPERYPLVEKMAQDLQVPLERLMRDQSLVDSIRLEKYVGGDVGMPTLLDIAEELKRPGRDPREDFSAPSFDDAITEIEHLKEGMILEGTVTNVTHFGAFVNIGVHQDGLVHVSHLSHRFVKDPTEVVSAGQRVKVKVLAVDLERRRISLSIREATEAPKGEGKPARHEEAPRAEAQRGGRSGKGAKQKSQTSSQQSRSGFGTLADKLKGFKLL